MVIPDDEFVRIVLSSRRPSDKLADELSVSGPTVRRWMAGRNLPYQAMRLVITKHIQETNARHSESN